MQKKLSHNQEISRNDHIDLDISFAQNFSQVFTCSSETLEQLEKITTKKFVLLHTGRCGSTLLHHMVSQCFCPTFEIFNDVASDPITQKIGKKMPLDIAEYVTTYKDSMFEDLDHADGSLVLSLSITPWQLMGLHAIDPRISEWIFRDTSVAILLRLDIIKQAISHASAALNNIWHQYQDRERCTDGAYIRPKKASVYEYLDLILWAEAALQKPPISRLLDTASSVIQLRYENLYDSKEIALRSILFATGYNDYKKAPSSAIPMPLKPTGDREAEELYRQVLDELPVTLPSGCVFSDREIFSRYGIYF